MNDREMLSEISLSSRNVRLTEPKVLEKSMKVSRSIELKYDGRL